LLDSQLQGKEANLARLAERKRNLTP